MEKPITIDEPSAYYSTVEKELSAVDVSVYSSALEEVESSASSQHWTTIESEDGNFVRVLPGRSVHKFEMQAIKLLEQIGEGAQGTIHAAQIFESKPNDKIYAVKVFKGRNCQWPDNVFGLHTSCQHICQFEGYCIDSDAFYLIMTKYDSSLRDVIDKQMKGTFRVDDPYCNGRPFPDLDVLVMIIHIALGMRFLHKNNIIHRDLKADNIFVRTIREHGNYPNGTFIGDFDVASHVKGTLFWRAPEVLQALKNGKCPEFTSKADVYSYAMTCYEILTGGIPFHGVKASDYDVVLSGKRPKLPSHLNPKMTDLISRCWHHCPDMRPTFNDIVEELKELHRDFVTGSELASRTIDRIFDTSESSLNIVRASPEANLQELKELLPALLVKYNQADFLLLASEIVADMEQFQTQFGLRSYTEQPVLPFPKWFARRKLYDSISWKTKVLGRIRANIIEMLNIARLMTNIIRERHGSDDSADIQFEILLIQPETVRVYEASIADFKAWTEECQIRVLPDYRHRTCLKRYGDGERQACDLCKNEPPEFVNWEVDKDNVKYCLYVDNGSAFSKLTTSVVSSLKAKIGALF